MIVFCLEHVQNSDTGSMTFCSKAGISSLQTSPFREIVGYTTEQLSSSSLCSSPDDASSDGIKLEETEAWQLRVVYSTTLPGMVLAICPYLDRYFLASAGNAVSCILSVICVWLLVDFSLPSLGFKCHHMIVYSLSYLLFSVLCLWFPKR